MTRYYNIHVLLHVIFHSWFLNYCPTSTVNFIFRSAAICFCCVALYSTHISSTSVRTSQRTTCENYKSVHTPQMSVSQRKTCDDHCHDKGGVSQLPIHTKAMYSVGFALEIQSKKNYSAENTNLNF
jgi:hypothetical protein